MALLLAFVANRIGDRTQIAESGRTVLMPLVPLGPREESLGERIELVYDLPDIGAGNRPAERTIRVALDDADIVVDAALGAPPAMTDNQVTMAYRFAAPGFGLLPPERPELTFGDGYFVVDLGVFALGVTRKGIRSVR